MYARSKLFQIMLVRELQRRLRTNAPVRLFMYLGHSVLI